MTFKRRGASEIKRVSRKISVGDDLYKLSEELEEYRGKFIVTEIDGEAGAIEFINGLKIFVGQAVGDVDEVAKYRLYDEQNFPRRGLGKIFYADGARGNFFRRAI